MRFLDRLLFVEQIERAIDRWDPDDRRRWAIRVGIFSVVAMVVNVALYVTGTITETHMILVTLVLSWLAVTVTCLDAVATTDVRREVE